VSSADFRRSLRRSVEVAGPYVDPRRNLKEGAYQRGMRFLFFLGSKRLVLLAIGAADVPHWRGRRCACSLPLPLFDYFCPPWVSFSPWVSSPSPPPPPHLLPTRTTHRWMMAYLLPLLLLALACSMPCSDLLPLAAARLLCQ
jgi:hypothetical protein